MVRLYPFEVTNTDTDDLTRALSLLGALHRSLQVRPVLEYDAVGSRLGTAARAVRRILTEGSAADSASLDAQRLPVHLDPVAVRVKAFERHVGCFIVPFHDGDAISFHAFHQRARQLALRP